MAHKLMWRQHNFRLILFLGLIALVMALPGCQIAQQETHIVQTFPEAGAESGAFGWVGVQFTKPMQQETVEEAFEISPDIPGQILWENNTFWFLPFSAFEQDTQYQASLTGDLINSDGKTIPTNLSWNFSIRDPELIYYVPEGDLGEIWHSATDERQNWQLSSTDGKVFDFSADQSGGWIVFSVQNDFGGQDLWIMDRDGSKQEILIDCQQDICNEAAWSIDQSWIAYSRLIFDEETGGFQSPQIWQVDVKSRETAPLYQQETLFAQSASFSPDGSKLAVYDITHQAIRVLDLQTSEETLIPRTLPGSGNWSADSSQILFTDEVPAVMEPFIELYIADVSSGEVATAFTNPTTDTDLSQPKWSPEGQWAAVSLRPVNGPVNKMLWVINLNGNRNIRITDDQSATFSAYQWDPWGSKLVYQRLELGSSEPQVSIWVWDWQTGESVMIIENGSRPAWMP